MKKKLILHAGCEKTGTTSIQHALAQARKQLAEKGVIFPSSLGALNHTNLITAMQDDDILDNIRAHQLSSTGLSLRAYRKHLATQLHHELTHTAPWDTLVVSTELIHSRLIEASELNRTIEFFSEYIDDIDVIIFIRRQDQLALSRFSTALRAGHSNFSDIFGNIGSFAYHKLPKGREVDDHRDYYNFKNLIQRFEGLTTKVNTKVLLYPNKDDPFDSVDLFAQAAGIEPDLLSEHKSSLNPAMSAQAQYIISHINKHISHSFPSGMRNDNIKRLYEIIECSLIGDARIINRDEAEAFVGLFEADNDWVRKRHFPQLQTLFSNDYNYPLSTSYTHLSTALEETLKQYLAQAKNLPGDEPLLQKIKRALNKCTR